ncbi:MAG: hypothetical protein LWX07_07890 [Bacteroidetes bacterium]|nr:hypothetical protein [Bacteroidota bacterium]
MKFLAPILMALLLIPASSFAQIKMMIETETAELQKVTAIKESGRSKISVYRYDYDEVEFVQDSSIAAEMTYDAGANVFTEIIYTPSYSKSVLTLNKDNKILNREIYDSKNNLTGKTIFHYDAEGKLESREIYLGAIKAFDEVYNYEGSELTGMKYVTAEGVLFGYSTFESDKWGNIIQETKYNTKDEPEYTYVYTYDSKSRCLEEKLMLGDKKNTIVSYHWKGNLLMDKITTDDNSKVQGAFRYKYDAKGLVTEEVNETPQGKITKAFDYQGGLVRQVKITDESDVSSYLLKYFYE